MSRVIHGGACAALLLSLLASACGGSPTHPESGDQDGTLLLSVFHPRGSLYVNDTTTVRIRRVRTNGDTVAVTGGVTWSTENPEIATVSATGRLTGVGYGMTSVTATTARGDRATLPVRVAGTLHLVPVRASTRWGLRGSPHVVESFLPVGGGGEPVTLTIDPGVSVLFREDGGLDVGLDGPGALVADGATSPITFEAEDEVAGAGSWRGLQIRGAGESELDRVTIRQCGPPPTAFPPYQACLMVRDAPGLEAPTIAIRNVTIGQGRGFGFVIESGVVIRPGSTGLSVSEIDGHAGYLTLDNIPRFPFGGSFVAITQPVIVIEGGQIATDTEWRDPGIPWLVIHDVIVEGPGGPTLTLGPGLDVRLDYGITIHVGRSGPGRLVAGAESEPPVSLDVGRWSGGGGWGGITFGPHALPSTLANVALARCGVSYACVNVVGDDVSLRPEVELRDVRILDAEGTGVRLAGGGRLATSSRDLLVTRADAWPLEVTTATAHLIPPGSYTDNGIEGVRVAWSPVRDDAIWRDIGLPYVLYEGLGLEDGGTITLEAGTRLEFAPGAGVTVGVVGPGGLKALGTPARPIVFGSIWPQAHPGIWVGINLEQHTDRDTRLEHVIVEWAGPPGGPAEGGMGGAIRLALDLGPMIRHTTVRASGTCAIRRDGGPWVTDFTVPGLFNRFVDNAGPPQCGP